MFTELLLSLTIFLNLLQIPSFRKAYRSFSIGLFEFVFDRMANLKLQLNQERLEQAKMDLPPWGQDEDADEEKEFIRRPIRTVKIHKRPTPQPYKPRDSPPVAVKRAVFINK